MFTTPPRPAEVTVLFPEIADLARTAVRLHPRRGTPHAQQSSVAGPMVWPADEEWLTCWLPHLVEVRRPMTDEEQELRRRAGERLAAAAARSGASSLAARFEARRKEAAGADSAEPPTVRTWEPAVPPEPVPLLPVLQLFAADAPPIAFPSGTDLLQLLWCPFQHQEAPGQKPHYNGPAVHLLWRAAAGLATAGTAPAPAPGSESGYLLQPCVLHPEQVTEYPDVEDLPEPLRSDVLEWEEDEDDPSGGEEPRGYDYRNDLSTATGLKAGGWPYWPHGPRPLGCPDCGGASSLLLTVPNGERGADSWTPAEEQHVTVGRADGQAFHDPTGFSGARDALMVFVCAEDPHHQAYVDIE
nr:hypothetical protein OH826_35835 [Streptomyces sp. NBC_00899]